MKTKRMEQENNPVLGGPDKPLWEDMKTPSDGRDKEALLAFEKAMIISNHMGAGASSDDFSDFKNEVIARMKDPPFSCTDECTGAVYSRDRYVFDASFTFYGMNIYVHLGRELNKLSNAALKLSRIKRTFEGI
ncbi:hypothetical protein DICVIV_12852 [Dictyocaulus viviparus]|uniref:Uncharacterized protein n=1 Tax=Dictyocaulus viviparus TaxID=29172 RepID=A0A0D8X9D0_DICVI|nr:hypothetical protein DICVIV_12852 [Dictyocaulus viviparus]